jgi:DNA-directed RNA polymerase subunit H (RpoH/RPB5)
LGDAGHGESLVLPKEDSFSLLEKAGMREHKNPSVSSSDPLTLTLSRGEMGLLRHPPDVCRNIAKDSRHDSAKNMIAKEETVFRFF